MGDASRSSAPPAALPHVVIFPFMSKGHTIPLLHLARLLHTRRLAAFTFLTTPGNAPFIRCSLADFDPAVVELPFPRDAPGLPPGVESTDQLPSMSLLLPFVNAVERLRPDVERAMGDLHPRPSFLISDGFHHWTSQSAAELGIPRLTFYGMGAHAHVIYAAVIGCRPAAGFSSTEFETIPVPGFPGLGLTRADLPPFLENPDPQDPHYQFVTRAMKARSESRGIILNTFYEMEPAFLDYWEGHLRPEAWCVGPLCLAQAPAPRLLPQVHADWLEARRAADRPVLYVAFGSQEKMSPPQLEELGAGLESSGVDFLWVVGSRVGVAVAGDVGFEDRVAGRGLVVREWLPQVEVLAHVSVRVFLSHCGWNSMLESVCAEVPILAWPVMAEQHLNARMVEELGIGVRVRTSDGTREGLVRRECVEAAVRVLMAGEKGREAAAKAAELGAVARRAVEEGGSSWCSLENMVADVCGKLGTRQTVN